MFNVPHHLWLRHIFIGIVVVIVKVTELSYCVSMTVSWIEALLEQPAFGAELRFVQEHDCGVGLEANVDFSRYGVRRSGSCVADKGDGAGGVVRP